ncbi:alkaline phosphatase D family protein [Aporhodopirellula aestuarii]|uniref:Alkaline phosphatase family protein n=1 Tax=Aporhodopirellula aestuarii TaxID=2950107 RepID=A0ABT0UAF7_9BACT|nr:alkaline phosphatase D family protein [Aporhodopirellula aestuarii]MCM2373850.1 alkaline phosphatase family protein [Aporhodopirellula aestuarii]
MTAPQKASLIRSLICSTVSVVALAWPNLAVAKEPLTQGEQSEVMKDLDPYMIEALYGTDTRGQTGRFGAEGGLADLLTEPAFVELVEKHDAKLFNGPMLGDIKPTSAKFWLRTAGPTSVQIKVGEQKSELVQTSAADDFTAVMTVNNLKPFSDYTYSVELDGKTIQRDSFRLRTAPERGQKVEFDVTFGSGARYVPTHEYAWSNMAKSRPLAYLGLGDNVYIDVVNRRGAQRLFYYRRGLSPAFRELTSSVAIYAVWDDHDMAMNDSAGGAGMNEPWKMPNWTVFKQNWNNPHYGGGEAMPGTWHSFSLGDVDFFMTDGRFYRDKKDKTMLGPDQKKWLLEELAKVKGKFKVIASGTMWSDGADKDGKDSWAGNWSRGERDEIFDLINDKKIDGVILISGDRHRSDIWKTDRPRGYPLYEFVSAKVTNEHTHPTFPNAVWSYNEGNFWGQLHFDLRPDDPVMTFQCVDISGKVVKEFPLKLSTLSHQ